MLERLTFPDINSPNPAVEPQQAIQSQPQKLVILYAPENTSAIFLQLQALRKYIRAVSIENIKCNLISPTYVKRL